MITFIIPCFNQLQYTKRCVESIERNSTGFNFVFIDNGSTDVTGEYLKSVINSHIITNQHNLFVNPAWNQGFEYVLNNNLGEYVCLCNNDIVAGKDWLKPIIFLLSKKDEFYMPVNREMHELDIERELITYPIVHSIPGFCIFMKKTHIPLFYPIPESIKVLRGDDWIMDHLYSNNIFGFKVNNCSIYHKERTTQQTIDSGMIGRDVEEFDRIVRNVYKSKGIYKIGAVKPERTWL